MRRDGIDRLCRDVDRASNPDTGLESLPFRSCSSWQRRTGLLPKMRAASAPQTAANRRERSTAPSVMSFVSTQLTRGNIPPDMLGDEAEACTQGPKARLITRRETPRTTAGDIGNTLDRGHG